MRGARRAVHVAVEGVRSPVARERIAAAADAVLRGERVSDAMLSITLVDDRAMARLNRTHLGHRGATDVISFGLDRTGRKAAVVGDIYIAPGVARENARREGTGVREEILRLVVHGVLHVVGHDHPTDEDRTASPMWRRQERYVARLAGPRARGQRRS